MSVSSAITGIRQVALTVTDVGEATVFYRDVLGLTYLFSPSDDLVFLGAGDVRLMLTAPQEDSGPGQNCILYFAVGNVEEAHETVVARGARSERGPQMTAQMEDHQLWIAFVRDPDGNLVGLMEERRESTG